jgi:hypothetical protein
LPDRALTANYAELWPRRDPAGSREILPGAQGVTTVIVFTTTLILIIAAVVARAGVATSRGSIHSLGDHFALSGHQLSSPSAGSCFCAASS